jgi:GDP-L-fucose synthase
MMNRIWIAGHRGMVGSSLVRRFTQPNNNLLLATSAELDLTDRAQTFKWVSSSHPESAIIAAAKVGGIGANSANPVNFLSDNVLIAVNTLDAAHEADINKLVFLGSSCIYPKFAEQPIREESLLSGPLEKTNEAYAIAKIAGIKHIQGYRQQYGRKWVSAQPTNLYGFGDNFDFETSHVLPALIAKIHQAHSLDVPSVQLWGSGKPKREFLFVDDLAEAIEVVLEKYDDDLPINIGTGIDLEIRELAKLISDVVGFSGIINWDTSKPDGTPRKLLDVHRVNELGWKAKTSIEDGIKATYNWYLDNIIQTA